MTIDELFERLSTYPRDAHVLGHQELVTGRVGIMVAWPDTNGAVRTVFIETPIGSAFGPRAPKKTTGGRKS